MATSAAAELVQWIGVGGARRPTIQEPSGPERAQHAAYIVSVLNSSDSAGRVEELRRIAVHGGFLSAPLRRRVWPLLLNLPGASDGTPRSSEPPLEHREKKQVQLDVVRSMTHFAMRRDEREARLKQLSRVIDSVLAANPTLHYYQGYNDVCSVAIMVMEEDEPARQVAEQLARFHLREAMNPTMAAVQEALTLMMLILKRRDKRLYQCLRACEVEPVFAISWIITWFAHDLKSLSQVERLYDFFLSQHPLMSLYFAASLLSWQRERLLKTDGDYAMVHQIMQELPRDLPLSYLIQDAHKLFQQAPPLSIVADAALASSEPTVFSRDSMWLRYPYAFESDSQSTAASARTGLGRRGGGGDGLCYAPDGVQVGRAWPSRLLNLDSIQIVWRDVTGRRRRNAPKVAPEGLALLRTALAGGGLAISVVFWRIGAPVIRSLLAGS
jgi:hypothetical protein